MFVWWVGDDDVGVEWLMGALQDVMFSTEHIGVGANLLEFLLNLLGCGTCSMSLRGGMLVKRFLGRTGLYRLGWNWFCDGSGCCSSCMSRGYRWYDCW